MIRIAQIPVVSIEVAAHVARELSESFKRQGLNVAISCTTHKSLPPDARFLLITAKEWDMNEIGAQSMITRAYSVILDQLPSE